MKTNYHTHTTRCMHATGDDEDYVLSAIKGGYRILREKSRNIRMSTSSNYNKMSETEKKRKEEKKDSIGKK